MHINEVICNAYQWVISMSHAMSGHCISPHWYAMHINESCDARPSGEDVWQYTWSYGEGALHIHICNAYQWVNVSHHARPSGEGPLHIYTTCHITGWKHKQTAVPYTHNVSRCIYTQRVNVCDVSHSCTCDSYRAVPYIHIYHVPYIHNVSMCVGYPTHVPVIATELLHIYTTCQCVWGIPRSIYTGTWVGYITHIDTLCIYGTAL